MYGILQRAFMLNNVFKSNLTENIYHMCYDCDKSSTSSLIMEFCQYDKCSQNDILRKHKNLTKMNIVWS